ncbi:MULTISPECIES: tannase/feruloyl esterase family alpha/beta hydrolase [Dickeya]|uniref:Tannase n=1 Tax=Dickeya aquatica TaxID=1401087 RepID=A0A375AFR8_9GAMM|nr:MULTISPECIES: tannase/feruloyl esterase family alpha/beta hydrolase [Dickeya]SLM64930.1 Tannase [Dickeya aquatica]
MSQPFIRIRYLSTLAGSLTLLFSALHAQPAQAEVGRSQGAALPSLNVIKATRACSDLTQIDLTRIAGAGSKITQATETSQNGLTYCTVDGVLAPEIGFQVQLPKESWTQRYLQVGCGGLCGNISTMPGAAEGCAPLNAGGFVIAGSDMGHDQASANSGEFGADPQKRADFAYRGVHLTSVAAKALIDAYYGHKAAYSYFTGCSDGGREALVEAQRFPEDFNGIIAGAPAMNFLAQNAIFHAWQYVANHDAQGNAILLSSRLPLIHNAVLAACDSLDGQTDGLIADPRVCHFNPDVLLCKGDNADTTQCLTQQEVDVVQRFYNGPTDPQTGEHLTAGGPMPGSELGWTVYVPATATGKVMSENASLAVLRYLAFANTSPTFTLAEMKFDRATFDRLRPQHTLYDATNTDLTRFYNAGHKLILWHGLSDPHISPVNTISYHETLEQVMGASRTHAFERLYLLPGVQHCSGGEGPSKIDLLTPIMNWVENGVAPHAIIATQTSGGDQNGFGQPGAPQDTGTKATTAETVVRTRPLYPFPYIAVYQGQGDVNSAASYTRSGPLTQEKSRQWMGSDFYRPYRGVTQ